jgi:hypothetical protein
MAKPLDLGRNPAALLPQQLRSQLGSPLWEDVGVDREYGSDLYVMGYHPPAAVDLAAVREAGDYAAAVRETCHPLEAVAILQELVKMRVKVGQRAQGDMDTQLQLQAYVEELSEYPADIVLETLRLWPKMSKWWPAWEELKKPLDLRTRQRAGFLSALEDLAERGAA